MMNIFLELVPLPISESELNPPGIFDKYEAAVATIKAGAATADDEKILNLSLKLFDNEVARKASIDSRASAMMTSITLAAALVTGVGFTMFKDVGSVSSAAFWSIFVSFAAALLYLTATAVLCIYIQGPIARATPDPTDLVPPPHAEPSAYPRHLAVSILDYTITNYKINNRAVSRVWLAQKCFRNALLTLVVGGIATAIIMMRPSIDAASNGLRLAQMLARSAGCADLPSLKLDSQGRWHGLCLFQGASAVVLVDADGRARIGP